MPPPSRCAGRRTSRAICSSSTPRPTTSRPRSRSRLASLFAAEDDRDAAPIAADVTARGRDLDRVLRSLEHGAAMPELPFAALESIEAPAVQSRASLTISGRHVAVAVRGGEGLVFVDDRPVGRPFPMMTAPTSKADVDRDPSGRTRVTWQSEGLVIELGPDFATADVRAAQD